MYKEVSQNALSPDKFSSAFKIVVGALAVKLVQRKEIKQQTKYYCRFNSFSKNPISLGTLVL
jgi:hypothetical protein